MQRQPNITLQSHNIDLLQEEVLMKNLTHTTDSMSTLYVGKRLYYPKEGSKELNHLSSNNPSKVRTILIPQHAITQDLNHPKRKFDVSDARKWVMELKITKYSLLKKR